MGKMGMFMGSKKAEAEKAEAAAVRGALCRHRSLCLSSRRRLKRSSHGMQVAAAEAAAAADMEAGGGGEGEPKKKKKKKKARVPGYGSVCELSFSGNNQRKGDGQELPARVLQVQRCLVPPP